MNENIFAYLARVSNSTHMFETGGKIFRMNFHVHSPRPARYLMTAP